MIFKTKIEWRQEKELDPLIKEELEAKAEFVTDYDPTDELYESIEKDCVIDTNDDRMYVQVSENKICMANLLGGEYMVLPDGIQRFEERIYFKGDLNDIYTELTKNN